MFEGLRDGARRTLVWRQSSWLDTHAVLSAWEGQRGRAREDQHAYASLVANMDKIAQSKRLSADRRSFSASCSAESFSIAAVF